MLLGAGTASASTWRADDLSWEFGLHPGAAVAGGEYRHTSLSSFQLAGSAGYSVLEWLVMGIEGGHVFGHKLRGTTRAPITLDLDRDGVNDVLRFDSTIRNSVTYGGGFFKLGPWLNVGAEGKWKPYAVLGAGLYHERQRAGNLLITGGRTSSGIDVAAQDVHYGPHRYTSFGVDGGVGFEVKIEDNGGIGAEARYRRFFRRGADYEALAPTLRLLYYF